MTYHPILAALAIPVLVSACGLVPHAEDAPRDAKADRAAFVQATSRCERIEFETQVAKARCLNDATERFGLAYAKSPDLLRAFLMRRIAIAEQVDAGRMSMRDGDREVSKALARMSAEDEKRAAKRKLATGLPGSAGPLSARLRTLPFDPET